MAGGGQKLLIIEDDPALGQLMKDYLDFGGFTVFRAATAAQGFDLFTRYAPALVLLDLELPDEDGLVVLRRLRQMGDVPVAIVSGRCDSDNRIAGLEMGADDFIAKPFVGRELVARVSNILRRSEGRQPPEDMSLDGLILRLRDNFIIGRDGDRIGLTRSESLILEALVHAGGRTLSRDQLMDVLGNLELAETTRSIDILISRLRAKLERDRKRPALILTVQGLGYRVDL